MKFEIVKYDLSFDQNFRGLLKVAISVCFFFWLYKVQTFAAGINKLQFSRRVVATHRGSRGTPHSRPPEGGCCQVETGSAAPPHGAPPSSL